MANLERIYVVPLRKEYLKAPNYKRTPKAARALKAFIVKHMKSDNVKIGPAVNEELWKHGIKNPPHHVKVTAIKKDDGTVLVEKFGVKFVEDKPTEKKVKDHTPMGKIKEALKEKKEEKDIKAKKPKEDDKNAKSNS